MEIPAGLVKELRERTGAGMMDCKTALVENGGSLDAAADWLRKQGAIKAEKKSGRVASEGAIVVAPSADGRAVAMVEVNSETDFVANDASFKAFAQAVAGTVISARPASVEALAALPLAGGAETVEAARTALVAKIGENIGVRRFMIRERAGDHLASYLHGKRIGVLVDLKGADEALARDIAMHIAASKPVCVDAAQIPGELLAKEREIYTAQAATSGKPAPIVEKMVEGRLKKYVDEITLLGQPFVKDPDTPVGKLVKSRGAEVLGFVRLELGEGVEKKESDFAAEVMAQVRQTEGDGKEPK
ncbi:MAG: translation elongation factor Ts [Gammaproteobacteria bacterium]